MAQYPYYGAAGWTGGWEDQRVQHTYLANAYDAAGAARAVQTQVKQPQQPADLLLDLDPLPATAPPRKKGAGKTKKAGTADSSKKAAPPPLPTSPPHQVVAVSAPPALQADVLTDTPKRKGMGRRPTSHVWEHYYRNEEKPGYVLCAHCDMALKHDSTCTGTSSLQRHLERKHNIYAPNRDPPEPKKPQLPAITKREQKKAGTSASRTSGGHTVAETGKMADASRVEALHVSLIKNIVIRDLRPLSVTLDPGIRAHLLSSARYLPMDPQKGPTLLQDLTTRVEGRVQTMLQSLHGQGRQVSLCWESWGIGGLTEGIGGWVGCWITDGWELQTLTLATAATICNPTPPLDGMQSYPVSRLQSMCDSLAVRPGELFMSVVGDPDAAMAADIETWEGVVHARNGPMVLHRIPHQALCTDLADAELVGLMERARLIAAHFQRNAQAMDHLAKLQEVHKLPRRGPLGYCEDGPWHHSYEVLSALCDSYPAIDDYSSQHPDAFTPLTAQQWTELAQVLGVLAPWKQAGDTSLRSGRAVMVSVYYALFTLVVARTAADTPIEWKLPGKDDTQQTGEDGLSKVALTLRQYLRSELQLVNESLTQDQWQLMVVASALDPRFKRLNFIHAEDREQAWQLVLAAADHQARVHPLKMEGAEGTGEPDAKRQKTLLEQAVEAHEDSADDSRGAEKEVEHYKGIKHISVTEDPLAWWQQKASIFPILSGLAQRYLAVPAGQGFADRLVARGPELLGRNWGFTSVEEAEKILLCHANYHLLE